MNLKLSNIRHRKDYVNIGSRLMVNLGDVYYELLTYYTIGDFYSFISYVTSNYFISYISLKYVASNDIKPRNLSMEKKLEEYFDYYKNYIQSAYDLGISDFINGEYEKHVLNCQNYYLTPMSKEEFEFKLDNNIKALLNFEEFNEECLDCSNDVYISINSFVENNALSKGDAFKIKLSDELELRPFNVEDKDVNSFFVEEPYENDEINRDLTYFRSLYGDKYGNIFYGIQLNATKNNRFYPSSSNIFDFNEDKMCYELYALKKVLRTLTSISSCKDYDKLENYILNELDELQNFPIDSLIYCNVFFNSNIDNLKLCEVINTILKAISFNVLISLCSDARLRWFEFVKKFVEVNKIIGEVPITFYKLKSEEISRLANTNFEIFVEYFCNRLDFDNIEFMQKNRSVIDKCDDEKLLNKIKNKLKDIIAFYEEKINYVFMDIPHSKLRTLIKQLNNSSDYTVNIPFDEMEIIKAIYDIQRNILDVNKKNKTTKEIVKLINESVANKTMIALDKVDFDVLVDLYQEYRNLTIEYEYIKERIFYVEYKDIFEKATETIANFKKEFYNKIKYDKNNYYEIFKNRLLSDVEDSKKEVFFKKWSQIIEKYNKNEIIDGVSTNEYVHEMLIRQDMELTPLLVCYLKAAEQFMCAYIHYMSNKGITPRDVKLPQDWENKLGMGLFLEEFIKNNIHEPYKDKLKNLYDEWSSAAEYWRLTARNSHLHKENVNSKTDLKNYIDGCIKLIVLSIKVALLFEK